MNNINSTTHEYRTLRPLQRVEPHKTLLCCSCVCEQQAAAIRNDTVTAMQANDIAHVAYRYLQTRRGEKNTLAEAIVGGSTFILGLFLLCATSHDPNDAVSILKNVLVVVVSFLIALPTALVNIPNTLRYRETKQACEAWLMSFLDERDVREIQKLRYNRSGLVSLSSFFYNKGISTVSLDNKLLKNNVYSLVEFCCPRTSPIVLDTTQSETAMNLSWIRR